MNKVQPIKDPEKLRQIQEDLATRTDPHGERMFLLFELGIHTGLRISEPDQHRRSSGNAPCGQTVFDGTVPGTLRSITAGVSDGIPSFQSGRLFGKRLQRNGCGCNVRFFRSVQFFKTV